MTRQEAKISRFEGDCELAAMGVAEGNWSGPSSRLRGF
jgi:hypothetical protein